MHRMRGGLVVLVAVVLVVVALVVAGMIHYQRSDDRVDVTIETGKLQEAAETAVEEGKEAIKETGKALERVGDKVRKGLEDDEP